MAGQEQSAYKNMDADRVARKYWGADHLVDLVAMVGLGLVIIGAVWLANRGQFWSYIVATVIAFVVFTVLNARRVRNFVQLQGILMVDCDAVKMVEVCERSAKRTRRGSERVRFRTLHAMALALSDRPGEALELMDGMPASLPPADALNMMSAQAAAFRMRDELDELVLLREHVEQVGASIPQNTPLSGAAAFLLAQIDFTLMLKAENYENAGKALDMIESKTAAPEREVEAKWSRALLYEAQGQLEQARACYEEVAERGGTLAICAKAREWLVSHPTQGALEAGE